MTLAIERGEKKRCSPASRSFSDISVRGAAESRVERAARHKEITVTPEVPLEGSKNPSIGVALHAAMVLSSMSTES